jgi:meso-butanediol dehydrogenase / (S,S)-butanediol dehydrogenase / diacetyl reductase
MKRFEDKVVLVTGAGAGIGRESAIMFAKEGAKVALNCLTIKNGEETLKLVKMYSEGMFVQGDVSLSRDAENMVKRAIETFGRLDILVNNAGIVIPGRVDNMTEEDWDNTMAVNLKGVFLVSKFAVIQMKKQGGGTIVHTSSVVAVKGVKERAAYTASKGGVLALTKAMAADYLEDKIRVNCVCPGTIDTPSLESRINAFSDPEKARQDFISRQPLKRLGRAEEVAEAILFAASEEAGFMDGSNIIIDGGMSI